MGGRVWGMGGKWAGGFGGWEGIRRAGWVVGIGGGEGAVGRIGGGGLGEDEVEWEEELLCLGWWGLGVGRRVLGTGGC